MDRSCSKAHVHQVGAKHCSQHANIALHNSCRPIRTIAKTLANSAEIKVLYGGTLVANGCGMAKSNSKKIVKVHDWRGELKRVELECGHLVERSICADRPLPKSNKLSCGSCTQDATPPKGWSEGDEVFWTKFSSDGVKYQCKSCHRISVGRQVTEFMHHPPCAERKAQDTLTSSPK